jgi:tRNA dimethylallyltransferase
MGPTAVGKTDVAIELAKHYQCNILSADSRQFYRELTIGTAKPSETQLTQIKHHFINSKSIEETYSAGDFERDALTLLTELFKKNEYAIMVGGSGLYIKAVTEGLDEMPTANETLRSELKELFQKEGIEALKNRLVMHNNYFKSDIDLNNPQRLMRAIEIQESGSIKKTIQKKERPFKVAKIVINSPREQLYTRINKRVDDMMKRGLLDEVNNVAAYKHTYALQTVGYKELFDYLEGMTTLDQAVDLIKQHTRNYAKRQLTWYRAQSDATWFEPHETTQMMRYIESFAKE